MSRPEFTQNLVNGFIGLVQKGRAPCRPAQVVLAVAVWVALFVSCSRRETPPSYFPETGKEALAQRSLDLQSRLNVLSIALEPGLEDLQALAYFRLGRGARIMSVYATNGESGESDLRAEAPPYLAAIRRREAASALSFLDGEVRFLNLPAISAARDSSWIRKYWPTDTLRTRLSRLLSEFQPDIVLIARDWASPGESLRSRVLKSDLMALLESPPVAMQSDGGDVPGLESVPSGFRILEQIADAGGIPVPAARRHPLWKKSYVAMGDEAARAYTSLKLQRQQWRKEGESSYRLLYPATDSDISTIDEGLPRPIIASLRTLEQKIRDLATAALNEKTEEVLPRIVSTLDSIGLRLAEHRLRTPEVRKALVRWKRVLEDLRCTLLGVKVRYTLSDSALTRLQLTYLTIDTVTGIQGDGNTSVIFGEVTKGWVVNEGFEKRLPLKLHQPYRLLSPSQIEYNFPAGLYGLQASEVGPHLLLFIVHRADDRSRSFIYRRPIRFTFAPRFVAEVLTPIVRMVPGERIVVRLMNLSRDGVADAVEVDDSLATSDPSPFRLSHKEASHLDTLEIEWKGSPPEGSYLIPVKIHGITVARFAARKFAAEVDRSTKIGVIFGLRNSALGEALRRLGVTYTPLKLDASLSEQVDSLNVVIIDRRALSLHPSLAEYSAELQQFVNAGGHLVILAQDADSWESHPLWPDLHLRATATFDEETPVRVDSTHALLRNPNPITSKDWTGWLFRRAYNRVVIGGDHPAAVPVQSIEDRQPLLVSADVGRGKLTYVDLALTPQLMNVHPGTYRLLANLVSY